MKSGVKEILGKTISGIVVKQGPVVPSQVFLVFDDGTNYEFYSGISRIEGSSGVCPGTYEDVRAGQERSEARVVFSETWTGDQACTCHDTQRKRLLWLAGYAADDVAQDLGGDFRETLSDMKKILKQDGPDGSLSSEEWMRATELVDAAFTLKLNQRMIQALKPLGLLIMLLSLDSGHKQNDWAMNQPVDEWVERMINREIDHESSSS